MRFKIDKARAIKPMVVRFNVLTFEDDDYLTGEYEIALDIDQFVTHQISEDKINIIIDAAAIQQVLTTNIAEMQRTSYIANGFNDLIWEAYEQGEEPEVDGGLSASPLEENNESTEYTGETIKLQPLLPTSD